MHETKTSTNKLTVSNDFSASGALVYRPTDELAPSTVPPEAEISAVYGHIQAIRALGRTTINTGEIATALSLPVATVNRAIQALKSRGVEKL